MRLRGSVGGVVVGLALTGLSVSPLHGQPPGGSDQTFRTSWGDPDLQGIWSYATITPLERPGGLAAREFLTDEEVAEQNRNEAIRASSQRRDELTPESDLALAYNQVWWDRGTSTGRTSLIVDPADGRLPPLTAEGERRQASRQQRRLMHPYDSWEDRPLQERCMTYQRVPPVPSGYSNTYHILQAPGYVAILNEMIHDVRVVPLDGRATIDPRIRQWNGDARGYWDGDTLVVETANYRDTTTWRFPGSQALRAVERFTRIDDVTIDYQFTIHDDTTYTRPWTARLPLVSPPGYVIYEYACHEGNYSIANVLAGARRQERAAEEVETAPRPEVTRADIERWKAELTNWGRWGPADQIGTLNLITPEKRRQAARLVTVGVSVSLARDAETTEAVDNPRPYQVAPLGITADQITISYHGFIHTHLDFLNHNFTGEGVTYNGYQPDPAAVARQGGHSRNTVHNAKAGILTRGVLIDMPRFKNVPYLEPGTAIYVEDLEAWEDATGITVSSGDAVFIRTGRWARRAELGPWDIANEAAGLHASVIPWLRERDIALLGGEAPQDVAPAGIDPAVTVPEDLGPRPLHRFALIYLGMPLFDNVDLEAVAAEAAARGRWEFLLTAAPLPTRGTGSPINPIASF